MRAGQRKAGRRVIEGTIRPRGRVVTGLASRRESGSNVIYRRKCRVVVVLVARDAGRAGQVVVVVHMAVSALPWWNRM